MGETELWLVFAAIFAALLLYDLLVVDRRSHEVTTRIALRDVAVYIAVAIAFGALVWYSLGQTKGTEFFAAYVIEFSMSVDNLFVFIILFAAFGIQGIYQHRVLFYGIMGAMAFRAVFVFVGAEMLEAFDWMMIVFGIVLIYAAYHTAFGKDDKPPEKSLLFRIGTRMNIHQGDPEGRFFVRIDGKRVATVMLACLVVIELTDVMFALDSIPAALSISTDVFIVFTSNMLAVLGLRSLYFVLKDSLDRLAYLKYGLGAILAFIGAKMFLSYFDIEISVMESLAVIVAVLAVTVAVSLRFSRGKGESGAERVDLSNTVKLAVPFHSFMKGDLHTLKRICEYGSKAMMVGEAAIGIVLLVAIILAFGSFASDAMADLLDALFGVEVPDGAAEAARVIEVVAILVLGAVTVWSIYRIMVSIRDEHSPFNEANTSILIRLSKIYLLSAFLLCALSAIASGFIMEAVFMLLGCILVSVVLYCYALTVRYGAVLQDESDHTL